jgi:hypothetical protein
MSGGFGDLGIMPEILTAIDEMGWGYDIILWVVACTSLVEGRLRRRLPRDVQDETIPLMLGGGDVMVVCQS